MPTTGSAIWCCMDYAQRYRNLPYIAPLEQG
jgi:hypoxanthine-guanine phosphoribosyltransferase